VKDFHQILRSLAKNNYWQTLYSLSKEGSLRVFYNDTDLSDLQFSFLKYLNFYSSLFFDVAMGDITDDVFKDEIYEDSYLMHKNKKDKKNNIATNAQFPDLVPTSKWIFKNKSKEK
jgi:hypothetical protein